LAGGATQSDLAGLHGQALQFGRPAAITSAPTGIGDGVLYVATTGAWLVETQRLPHAAKGAGDLFAALFTARRARGQSLVVALEAAVGAVHDVIIRSMAAGEDGLAMIEAQDKLEFPDTWPTARQYRP
jgi:pyridoxine kinase